MHHSRVIISLFLLPLLSGCSKKEAGPQIVTDVTINQWMLDRMRVYYYWNTSLPSNPDYNQEPYAFFDGLKNASDRFSRLYYKKDPQGFDGSMINNFGFDLTGVETPAGFLVSVTLVVPGSQAETSGVVRGQYISTINGQTLTKDNIRSVTENAVTQVSMALVIEERAPIILSSAYVAEPFVYRQSVISAGGHNAGYLFIGPFDYSGAYDIINACQYFKSRQIDDLIIDLRYSPGGSVPFSALVTALLAPVKEDELYTIFKGNVHAGTIKSSFKNELAKQPEGYSFTMESLLPYQMKLPTLYILTTGQTASAAELITNNLKPYVKVIQIGERTLGKDMASLAISDERKPPVFTDITLFPMVFKLSNALGSGDYPQGLTPDYSVAETDMLPLKPLGSPEDPLIRKAIELITGDMTNIQGARGGRQAGGAANKVIYESRAMLTRASELVYVP